MSLNFSILLPLLPKYGDYGSTKPYAVLKIKFRALRMLGKHSTNRTTSSAPSHCNRKETESNGFDSQVKLLVSDSSLLCHTPGSH